MSAKIGPLAGNMADPSNALRDVAIADHTAI